MKIKQTIAAILIGFACFIPAIATPQTAFAGCAGVDTSIINCDSKYVKDPTDIENSGLWGVLIVALNILTLGVGVVAVGGIVYGGILYTTSGGDPSKRKKAITTISNVIIGLVMYGLMYSLLNFMIPGGVFRP